MGSVFRLHSQPKQLDSQHGCDPRGSPRSGYGSACHRITPARTRRSCNQRCREFCPEKFGTVVNARERASTRRCCPPRGTNSPGTRREIPLDADASAERQTRRLPLRGGEPAGQVGVRLRSLQLSFLQHRRTIAQLTVRAAAGAHSLAHDVNLIGVSADSGSDRRLSEAKRNIQRGHRRRPCLGRFKSRRIPGPVSSRCVHIGCQIAGSRADRWNGLNHGRANSRRLKTLVDLLHQLAGKVEDPMGRLGNVLSESVRDS